ncbi:ribosomal protein LP0 [Acrasis kona]|uniref:Ribosomal protein LP0 n=1 Tax=Acrasis kona TaxID=1008807 RepID=A0AAW2YJC3_9EUKA
MTIKKKLNKATKNGNDIQDLYIKEFALYLDMYKKMLIVQNDHFTSNQILRLRTSLRGKAVLVMGRNKSTKRALQNYKEKKEEWTSEKINISRLYELIEGNMGIIFTNDPLYDILHIIHENHIMVRLDAEECSPVDVMIPEQETKLPPHIYSLFYSANVKVRILRGCLKIVDDVLLIKSGEKVSYYKTQILDLLEIKPVKKSLKVVQLYEDGCFYDPSFQDKNFIHDIIQEAVCNVVAVSLAAGICDFNHQPVKNVVDNPELLVDETDSRSSPDIFWDMDILWD